MRDLGKLGAQGQPIGRSTFGHLAGKAVGAAAVLCLGGQPVLATKGYKKAVFKKPHNLRAPRINQKA